MTPFRLTTKAVPVAAANSRARCAALSKAACDSRRSRSFASSIGRLFKVDHSNQLELALRPNYRTGSKSPLEVRKDS